jgi:dCTP deaminase
VGVVCKKEILRRLAARVDDRKQLVVTPLLNRDEVFKVGSDVDSIDLRLGNSFLLPRVPPLPYTFPSPEAASQSHMRVLVPYGKYLVLPAHQTVLGATLEFIKLPMDLCGEVLTKSSVARTFIVVETAPWIHPHYRGCLTLEIANVSNTPVILYPGRSICQLVLMDLNKQRSRQGKLSGTYIAPVYPEAPEFSDPQKELKKIGVPEADFLLPGHNHQRNARANKN